MLSRTVRRAAQTAQRNFAAQAAVQKEAALGTEAMKSSKHDFVSFINKAVLVEGSSEKAQLYKYLTQCFVDNDTDYDGLVSYRGFNSMVAEAALAPRRFGFAPHTRELFTSKEEYDLQRVAMFKELAGNGERITLEGWLKWCTPHIKEKVGDGLVEHAEARWERTKEDLISFAKGIAKEKSSLNTKSSTSTQYKELYMLNNQLFAEVDKNMDGLLDESAVKGMLAKANEIPKKFGMDWYGDMKMKDITPNMRATWAECHKALLGRIVQKAEAL